MEELTEARGRSMVGNEMIVLVDSAGAACEGRPTVARTAGQAWEMDGTVCVEPDKSGPGAGDFVRVKVTGVAGFDLNATLV
jgi:tRNA A37 methylthiotransferase MiaB